MAFRADDISINTLVGNGSFIKGNLTANGFIRIDGDLDGDLTTDGAIIVGEKPRIKGNLVVKSAIIGGVVLGDVSATESVKLLSSSVVLGNIISKKVQMEENVVFQGHCISIEKEEKYKLSVDKFLQAKAIREKAVLKWIL